MGRIYATHGTIENLNHARFTHRGLSDRKLFTHHLRTRSEKYVSWPAALRGEGDALTVDDATIASAEAAKLAVEYGHEVTLLVNPGYIEYQQPHFFSVLSSVLERAKNISVTWQRNHYDLNHLDQKTLLRAQVKKELRQLSSEKQRFDLLKRLAKRVGSVSLAVPDFLATVGSADLHELVTAGIGIDSHGWFHGEPNSLSLQEQIRDITSARKWLNQNLGVDAAAYAVPFGETLPSEKLWRSVDLVFLCLNDNLPAGILRNRIVNRTNLRLRDLL